MADRLLATAPACTAPVIIRKRFKVPVQTRSGRAGSRRVIRAGDEWLPRRAGKDLLPAMGRAAGDVLTVSTATGFVDGRESAGLPRHPVRPGNGHKGGVL